MEHANCINYIKALERLVTPGVDSTPFTYHETKIKLGRGYYTVDINTGDLFAGDVLDHFYISAENIRRIGIKIDNVLVWLDEVSNRNEMVLKPFADGIYTVACDLSTIRMYIVSDTSPTVQSMYYLIEPEEREKLRRVTMSFRDGAAVMNGYFGSFIGTQRSINYL